MAEEPSAASRSASQCPQCSAKFPSKARLRRHINSHRRCSADSAASSSTAKGTGAAKEEPEDDSPDARRRLNSRREEPLKEEDEELIPEDPRQSTEAEPPAASALPEGLTPEESYASAECRICGKSFCGSFNVRRHIIRVHGIVLPKLKPGRKKGVKLQKKEVPAEMATPVVEPKDGVMDCPASGCSRTFADETDLRRHFKLFHSRRKSGGSSKVRPSRSAANNGIVNCDACGKTFRDGYNLRRHEIAVHINGGTPHRSRKRPGDAPDFDDDDFDEDAEVAAVIRAPVPVKMYRSREEESPEPFHDLNASIEEKSVECEICDESFPGVRELRRHQVRCVRQWEAEEMGPEPGDVVVKEEDAPDAVEWSESGRPKRAATERRASTDWTALQHFCMLCGAVFPSDAKVASHLTEAHRGSSEGASEGDAAGRVARLLASLPAAPLQTSAFRPSDASAFRRVGTLKQEPDDEDEEEEEVPPTPPPTKDKRAGRSEFFCTVCLKPCRDRYAFRKHMTAHENGTARGPNSATRLSDGGDPAEVRARLKRQKDSTEDAGEHACPSCEEGFPNRQELLFHKSFCTAEPVIGP